MKVLILSTLASLGLCCSPPVGWKPLTLEELIPKYDLVVLGTDLKHHNTTDPRFSTRVSKRDFRIFCILKGDDKPIQELITLPDNDAAPCSQIVTKEGKSYIMGLSRVNATSYVWSVQYAALESVSFDYDQSNIKKLCGMKSTSLPVGSGGSSNDDMTCSMFNEKRKMACPAGHPEVKGVLVMTISVVLAYMFLK